MTEQFSSQVHDNGVAEVVLNRPPVNALNSAGWYGLAAEIHAMGERPEVRVIVVRAEGRGFCAGVDIKELAANDKLILDVNAGNYATFKAVHLNKVPVIAAVQGFVLGGGIGICGAADIVIVLPIFIHMLARQLFGNCTVTGMVKSPRPDGTSWLPAGSADAAT